MDRGVWWAPVHGVTKSQTRLSTHAHRHDWVDLNDIRDRIEVSILVVIFHSSFASCPSEKLQEGYMGIFLHYVLQLQVNLQLSQSLNFFFLIKTIVEEKQQNYSSFSWCLSWADISSSSMRLPSSEHICLPLILRNTKPIEMFCPRQRWQLWSQVYYSYFPAARREGTFCPRSSALMDDSHLTALQNWRLMNTAVHCTCSNFYTRVEKLTRNRFPAQKWQRRVLFTRDLQSYRPGWTPRISPLRFIPLLPL